MIQSPLNYTGGKYKLLPQILPLFPKDIDTFIDLFCGGCNVGINVESNAVVYNDANEKLQGLLQFFQQAEATEIISAIDRLVVEYELSQSSKNGYGFYGCDSSAGLGSFNKKQFLSLRNDFNKRNQTGLRDFQYWTMLYTLIVFSFNNQMRFNTKGDFNLPVGKRDFNNKMRKKLTVFLKKLKSQKCSFTCEDFQNIKSDSLSSKDFVYADPPYLITCATYNEQGGWREADEQNLLLYLDELDSKGIRFALSNVLFSKGKENTILQSWLKNNMSRYKAILLNYSYANASYHSKGRELPVAEVLVVNY